MKFCLELKKNWLVWLFFIFWLFFFSFRLTKIPPGINIDESSIGYNASLIADTLHDENGRFLPVFFLTIGQKDWKQPVRIYTTALFFRLFGNNYFNLRFVSVIMGVFSGIIFYLLLRLFFSRPVAVLGTFFLFSSPPMLIQSHLALENIDCLPFFLLWLYFLLSFLKTPRVYKIVLSGIFLGVSFYSYKGMHAYVWMYLAMTLFSIPVFLGRIKVSIRPVILFLAGAAPFLLPLKFLQTRYAGAVYDPATISLPSFFDSANVFLSTFDFSFLFLKGDKMLIHSTGYHGMFLVSGLFFLVIGLAKAVKKNNRFFNFLFWVLVATPLPLIVVGSVYRASRLMVLIPLFSFIFTLGLEHGFGLKQKREKVLLILLTVLYLINWLFFVVYYFGEYPKTIAGQFSPDFNSAMKVLSRKSAELKKTPFVEKELFLGHKEDIKYFWLVYFPDKKVNLWEREKFDFPKDGLILTGIGARGETVNSAEIPALQSGQKTLYIVGAGD